MEQEKKKKSKLVWIILVIIAIAIVGAAISSGSDDDVHQAENKTASAKEDAAQKETTAQKTNFNVGETAEYKDIQVTLKEVITSNGDDLLSKPDDGKEYAICVFEINNNSENDISMSSVTCFEAYCDDMSMEQDILGLQAPEAKKYSQLDGDIAAGKKMEGAIVYQVSKDWKEIEINVSPGFWSVKDIKFIAKNK